MIFKHLDFISPTITFYYKGYLSHSSILSGILSLFSFIIIITLAVTFSFELFKRQHPTVTYFNSFQEDAGVIPLNSSSLFHFISLKNNRKKFNDEGVDFRTFRIIGMETYYPKYKMGQILNITNYDHWLYGNCNIEKDAKNIEHLINIDFFPNSACIRKYFNSTENKYYDTWDPKFKWPILAHGTYNLENKFYCIAIEKCSEETINLILNGDNQCRSDDEIREIIGVGSAAHLYFIDNYIDVLNYTNPITSFLYRVENAIQLNNYVANNINFNPSLIKTHNGFVLDNIEYELSFSYERNDIDYKEDFPIYTLYYLWLKNRINYYERSYKRIQDVVSDIGGIFYFISLIAIYINRLYNNYIILFDTEDLLKSLIKVEREKHEKHKIDYSKKLKDIKDINNKHIHKPYNKNFEKVTFNKDGKTKEKKIEKKINEESSKSKEIFITNNILENKIEKVILNRKNAIKTNFNFWYFFLFKLSFEKKNLFFKVYQDFRIKIISEEHLIRNHLNIYNLLKVNERKMKTKKRHSYEITDLLNLI